MSRGLMGSWSSSASRTRTCASPSRSKRPRSVTCGERPRKRARPSTQRGNRSKVSCIFRPLSFVDLGCSGSAPDFCFFLPLVFRPADRPGEHDHSGRGCADGLQLLTTGVGGVAGCCPRGLPGG
jgi:hypothetical protein